MKKTASPLSQMHPPKIQFCDIYIKRSAINMLGRSAFRAWRTGEQQCTEILYEQKRNWKCCAHFHQNVNLRRFYDLLWLQAVTENRNEMLSLSLCTMDRREWWWGMAGAADAHMLTCFSIRFCSRFCAIVIVREAHVRGICFDSENKTQTLCANWLKAEPDCDARRHPLLFIIMVLSMTSVADRRSPDVICDYSSLCFKFFLLFIIIDKVHNIERASWVLHGDRT